MENVLVLLMDPYAWFLLLLGNVIGLIFGVIPGLNGGMAFIVLLPLTYSMEPEMALLFLTGLLGAQYFSGAIPAILIKIPGTSMSAATVFEGYPMAQRGEAARAIGITAASSTFGGLIGLGLLILVMPFMKTLVLAIGSPELFWIVFIGLLTIGLAAQGEALGKSLVSGGIGLMISMVGFSPVLGQERFTMGSTYLWDGIHLAPLFVGLFSIAMIMEFIMKGKAVAEGIKFKMSYRQVWQGCMDVIKRPASLIRSSLIGSGLGTVPGIGGTAANFITYIVEKQVSKTPEKFYKGHIEGLIASEASNNAKEGGSMLPTLAFGIPGSFEGALVLSAFILHGIQPGPFLIRDEPSVVWALIGGLILAQILASVIGVALSTPFAKLTLVRMQFIAPFIIVFSFLGAYLYNNNIVDVIFAMIVGLIGFFFVRAGYSIITLIIGFILGVTAEQSYYQSLASSSGSYLVFFQKTSLGLAIAALLLIVAVIYLTIRNKKKQKQSGNPEVTA